MVFPSIFEAKSLKMKPSALLLYFDTLTYSNP